MQFRLWLSVFLLILANSSAIKGVNTATKPLAGTPRLQLSARIVEYHSCSPDELSLELSLIFRNAGTTNIILDKRSSGVASYVVSRNLKEFAAGQFETDSRSEADAGPPIPWKDNEVDESNLIKLAPGEIYETTSNWSNVFFIVNDGSPHTDAGLKYGSHVLQVEVSTWVFPSEEAARRARRKLKKTGYLWTRPVKSSPIAFTIDPNRPISKCE